LIVLPTDLEGEVETTLPSGKKIALSCRGVDLDNAGKLKGEAGVIVVDHPNEILAKLA